MSDRPPLSLDQARERLRELGYLNGRVERFVFARALEGRRGVLLPAVVAAALAPALACVAAAASGELEFAAAAAAPAVLLLHLAVAFLLPAAAAVLLLGALADRSRAPAAEATAAGIAGAAVVFFLWIAGAGRLARGAAVTSLVWGIPVAFVALVLARTLRSGYLARAYARSHALPHAGRRGLLALAAAAGLAVAAGVFAARPEPAAPPPLHVSAGRPPVVVVAVDGIEFRAEGPAAASPGGPFDALLARAATGWWPAERGSPPEIWTTVATGVSPARHGVRALERVRPIGSPSALVPPLGTAWYLRRLGPALSLVSPAPVSAADRRALAFWEVSASAGLPSSAVGWWASGPWPGASVTDNRQILGRAGGGEEADSLALDELLRRRGDVVTAVYLPGPDILRGEPARRDREAARLAERLGALAGRAAAGEIVLVVVTGSSHGAANGGGVGAVSVFDGGPPRSLRARPTDVAPSVLARAGVPAAADLDGRPVAALFREGSLETLTVPTWGPRREPSATRPATSDREYLKKLKALGYLQ